MNRVYRFRAALALGVLAFGCGFPVDDSKYEIEDQTPVEQIAEAFSEGNQGCKACLESACVNEIKACAATEGCTEFAKCVRKQANPAGQARCSSGELDVPFAANLAYTGVVTCWMGCPSQCAVGRNWGCLDGYTPTQPPSTTVTIRQSFSYLCERGAVPGARVSYCDDDGLCVDTAPTDDTGTSTFHLPINVNGPLAGLGGFRLVEGEYFRARHRLERNLPIWSDQVESTRVLTASCASIAAYGLAEIDGSAADWYAETVGVQTFDCHTSGAEGVALEIPTAPAALILYTEDDGSGGVRYIKEGTTASGDGLALVANLPPGKHEIVAREMKSGKVVGSADVTVPTSDVILYSVLPESRK
jgi:hypothetical protein